MEHIGGLDALALGELGTHSALHVVTAANTIDFRVAALGHLGIRIGGGNVAQLGRVILLGGGNLHAGVVVADDAHDRGIGNDGLGICHAGVRIGLVVEGSQFDLEAHLGQGLGQLLDSQLGATLDVRTHHGLSAGQGALGRDLDGLLFFPATRDKQA